MFLVRSRRKYPKKSQLVFLPALLLLLGGVRAVWHYLESLHAFTMQLESWLSFVIPDWVPWVLEILFGTSSFSLSLDIQMLTATVWIALWIYVVLCLTYVAMRRMVRRWDLEDYRSLTGEKPTVHWTTNDAS